MFGNRVVRGVRLLAIGLPLGFVLAWAPGTFFVSTLALLTCALIRRMAPRNDRRFLLILFLLALVTRFTLSWVYQMFFVEARLVSPLGPDGELYSAGGWYISSIIAGKRFVPLEPQEFQILFPKSLKHLDFQEIVYRFQGKYLPPLNYHATGFFTYAIAFFYSMVGYAPLAFKWFNGFLGSILPLLGYAIGGQLYGQRAGRISAVLLALHPFLLLWSITALRDTVVILCVAVLVLSTIRILKGRWIWLLGWVGAGVGLYMMHWWIWPTFWASLGAGLLGILASRYRRMARWIGGGVAAAIVVGWVLYSPVVKAGYDGIIAEFVKVNAKRYGGAGAFRYQIFPPEVYQKGIRRSLNATPHPFPIHALKVIPVARGELTWGLVMGLSHLTFLPFPCCAEGRWQALAIAAGVGIWYPLIPFMALGFLRSCAQVPRATIFLGSFTFAVILIIGATHTNVWVLVRHRDILSPLLLVWAGGGMAWVWTRLTEAIERKGTGGQVFVRPGSPPQMPSAGENLGDR